MWYFFKVLLNFMYAQGFEGIWFLSIYLRPPAQVFDYFTLGILGQPIRPPPMTSHQKISSCGFHCSLEILCKFLKFPEVSTWNFDWNHRTSFYQIEKNNVILYWKVITLKSIECHFLIEITFYVLSCNFSIHFKMIWNLPRKSEWWVGHSFSIIWEQKWCSIAMKCTFLATNKMSQNSGNYLLEFCVY